MLSFIGDIILGFPTLIEVHLASLLKLFEFAMHAGIHIDHQNEQSVSLNYENYP